MKQVRGPTNQIKGIINGMDVKRFFHYLNTISDEFNGVWKYGNVQLSVFPSTFGIRAFRFSKSCLSNKYDNFDIIHAHEMRNFESEIARKLAYKRKIPLILSMHGTLNGFKRFPLISQSPYRIYDIFFGKRVIQDSNLIITNSYQEYQELLRFGIPNDKLKKIFVGIPKPYFNFTRKPSYGQPVRILFVGRILPGRKVETILHALILLLQQGINNFVLTIVYSGSLPKELIKLREILSKKWNAYFQWCPSIYGKDLIDKYHNSDIFVYPSLYENYGQPISEAAASGNALITSPVGIANEIAKIKGALLIQNPNSPKELSLHLRRLIQSPEIRHNLASNAYNFSKKEFNTSKITSQYEKLYLEIIE